jgi:hypothetical protein
VSSVPDNNSDTGFPVLAWLADVPLFIDRPRVASFYDAVFRPAARPVRLDISAGRMKQLEKTSGLSLGVSLPAWFPWLRLDAGGQVGRDVTTSDQQQESISLEAVDNAERQLVELALHYLVNLPERVAPHDSAQSRFPAEADILASPRMLAFLDAAPGTKIVPQAAELDNGSVKTFYRPLAESLHHPGGKPAPRYPDDLSSAEGKRQREEYWDWFEGAWSPDLIVQVMEDVIEAGGRPRWIDYRVYLATGERLYMHMAGHGDYDTGVYAYNLVKRGWRHGLRIVGTLKSKPAMNVLAVYEK